MMASLSYQPENMRFRGVPVYTNTPPRAAQRAPGGGRGLLEEAGVEVVRLPYRSPNLNAYAERFVRSIKDECLDRMIFFGERSLRKATREYAAHDHRERNHQDTTTSALIRRDWLCRRRSLATCGGG